jgi:hypothetical protein
LPFKERVQADGEGGGLHVMQCMTWGAS